MTSTASHGAYPNAVAVAIPVDVALHVVKETAPNATYAWPLVVHRCFCVVRPCFFVVQNCLHVADQVVGTAAVARRVRDTAKTRQASKNSSSKALVMTSLPS